LFQNSCQHAIAELLNFRLPHHHLLVIPISIDYDPWLVDNGIIFFEEKISSIPARFCKVELHLITLNSELQVFHTFSNDYVPNPQLFQNSCQHAIAELLNFRLPHHLLLVIPISIDYDPWLVDNGIIFFEEKMSSIPARLCKVVLNLITLNSELQVFYTLSDDYVPNLQSALCSTISFRWLLEFKMKEILRDRMFKSGSYKSQHEHAALYDTLETFDTREAPFSSSKQKTTHQSKKHVDYVPIPDDLHISESKDTGVAHLVKI
nr:hypothetical protein [Tanacetum cinerariifolium]